MIKIYIKIALISSAILFIVSFFALDKAALLAMNMVKEPIRISSFDYDISARFYEAVRFLAIFLLYCGLILCAKPLLQRMDIPFKTSFVYFVIGGFLIAVPLSIYFTSDPSKIRFE